MNNIIIENKEFTLIVSPQCIPLSLICKRTGEECLMQGEDTPLFSMTEGRPYQNEVKLSHPNKRMTFCANEVVRDGNLLTVGFELLPIKATVEIKETDEYVTFELIDFIDPQNKYKNYTKTMPPVLEFRLIQLPIKNRKNYGDWLNVMWDENAAVNVLANSPWACIDSEKRRDHRIMYACAKCEVKMKHCSASLIVTPASRLLDAIDKLEEDYDLPRGVKSRRDPRINRSIYWTGNVWPSNVDEHIARAKQGGFTMFGIYYSAFCRSGGYDICGDYENFNDRYPNGLDDIKYVIDKIRAAGITPGLHVLQTFIGVRTKYVTPVADSRLNKIRYFSLAKSIGLDDGDIYVDQNPEGAEMHPKSRVLQFGGEMITYENYTTEYPFKFTGCKRGHWETNVVPHEKGTVGGLADVTEFGGSAIYADQNTDLQDEVAEKIAEIYNLGFGFLYFDGSEGANLPYEIHVPNAQYKVYKKCTTPPVFCEAAAKAHFSWHFLSGGNAFDKFPTPLFKEKIIEHPFEEAPRMACDFTRLDFGWWGCYTDTMPDVVEFGTSKAAAWDCPVTIQFNLQVMNDNKRYDDNLEVLRRWEDVRIKNWLTDEHKMLLRQAEKEFTLLINEKGEYELVEYTKLKLPEKVAEQLDAYYFERNGRAYATLWHLTDECKLKLNLPTAVWERDIAKETTTVTNCIFTVGNKAYISTDSKDELIKAFANAEIVE